MGFIRHHKTSSHITVITWGFQLGFLDPMVFRRSWTRVAWTRPSSTSPATVVAYPPGRSVAKGTPTIRTECQDPWPWKTGDFWEKMGDFWLIVVNNYFQWWYEWWYIWLIVVKVWIEWSDIDWCIPVVPKKSWRKTIQWFGEIKGASGELWGYFFGGYLGSIGELRIELPPVEVLHHCGMVYGRLWLCGIGIPSGND